MHEKTCTKISNSWSPGIVECVAEYIFLISIKNKEKNKKIKKAKESKEEKSISVEHLTGYDDTVCKKAA